jgi:hypothetical protein
MTETEPQYKWIPVTAAGNWYDVPQIGGGE